MTMSLKLTQYPSAYVIIVVEILECVRTKKTLARRKIGEKKKDILFCFLKQKREKRKITCCFLECTKKQFSRTHVWKREKDKAF